MNIEHMKVAIRPMSSNQAIDLGMSMARSWFLPLWSIWWLMVLPLALSLGILFYFIFDNKELAMGIAMIVLWWCKPLYEVAMVWWLGHTLFFQQPSIKETFQAAKPILLKLSLKALFVFRFSGRRHLILPIMILEKPQNKAMFEKRLLSLSFAQGGSLTWHTIILWNIEGIFTIGLILLLYQVIPIYIFGSTLSMIVLLDEYGLYISLMMAIFYVIAMSVVAPFFVSSGFAVYLTKRCLLEGWDIELVFKQLARRYIEQQVSPLEKLKRCG